jgi:hypothetical protein
LTGRQLREGVRQGDEFLLGLDNFTALHDFSESRHIANGVNYKHIGTFNGKKVMIKGDDNCESIKEFLCSKLGKHLGININTVSLSCHGDILGLSDIISIHEWEEDFKTVSSMSRHILSYVDDEEQFEKDRLEKRAFDTLVDNDDIHGGNYGVLNGRLFSIDYGLSAIASTRSMDEDDLALLATGTRFNTEVVKRLMMLEDEDLDKIWKVDYSNFDDWAVDLIKNYIELAKTRILYFRDYVLEGVEVIK